MGSLGKASLSLRQIGSLVELVTGDLHTVGEISYLEAERSSRLELVADLLEMEQRMFLTDASWQALGEDKAASLATSLDKLRLHTDFLSLPLTDTDPIEVKHTPEIISTSPFYSRVLRPMLAASDVTVGEVPERISNIISTVPYDESVSPKDIKRAVVSTFACARHFPAGSCWSTSRSDAYWRSGTNDELTLHGSPFDNSCVVYGLFKVVERCGSSAQDTGLQRWVLSSLIAMAGTYPSTASFDNSCLSHAWRRIWRLFFRNDLRFRGLTRNIVAGTLGELMCRLLTEIISKQCTEISVEGKGNQAGFVLSNQEFIWKLPPFSASYASVVAPYVLVYTILSKCGLSESSSDTIGGSAVHEVLESFGLPNSRRTRLLVFCASGIRLLKACDRAAPSTCVASLIQGRAPLLSSVLRFDSYSIHSKNVAFSEWIDYEGGILAQLWQPLSCEAIIESQSATHEKGPTPCPSERDIIPREDIKQHVSTTLQLKMMELSLGHCKEIDVDDDDEGNRENLSRIGDFDRSKLRLTCLLLSSKRPSAVELEHTSKCIVQEIEEVLGTDGFAIEVYGLNMLLLVRGMTALSAQRCFEWPSEVIALTVQLHELCMKFLKAFDKRVPVSSTETESQSVDDFDFPVRNSSSSRKRKDVLTSSNGSKRRAIVLGSPPKVIDALSVVILSLSLLPNGDCCGMVLRALTGIDRPGGAHIDVFGGVVAAILLSSNGVLYYSSTSALIEQDSARGNVSVVPMILRIIQHARDLALPHSTLHAFGSSICGRVLRFLGQSENHEEFDAMLELVEEPRNIQEHRSFIERPALRAERLLQLLSVFESLSQDESRLSTFMKDHLLPSLIDLSSITRICGLDALATIRYSSSSTRVVQALDNRVPQVKMTNEEEIKSYRTWYSKMVSVDDKLLASLQSQAWDDALLSIRFSSLRCRAELVDACDEGGGSLLLSITTMASHRPEYEAFALTSILKSVQSQSIDFLRRALQSRIQSLVTDWMASSESFYELPLCVTAPTVLRSCVLFGFSETVCRAEKETGVYARLKDASVSEFMSLYSSYLLCPIIIRSVSAYATDQATKEWRRQFLEDGYLRELCSSFDDHFDDKTVNRILKSHASEVLAVSSWLQNGRATEVELGEEILRFFLGLLFDGSSMTLDARNGLRTMSHLLDLYGSMGNPDQKQFEAAIGTIGKLMADETVDQQSCLHYFDLFVFAVFLQTAVRRDGHEEQSWVPISLVLSALRSCPVERDTLNSTSACLELLLEHVSKSMGQSGCEQPIIELKKMLHFLGNVDNTTSVQRQHLAAARTLLRYLAKAQRSLISLCEHKHKLNSWKNRIGLGLNGVADTLGSTEDTWHWHLESFNIEAYVPISKPACNKGKHLLHLLDAIHDALQSISTIQYGAQAVATAKALSGSTISVEKAEKYKDIHMSFLSSPGSSCPETTPASTFLAHIVAVLERRLVSSPSLQQEVTVDELAVLSNNLSKLDQDDFLRAIMILMRYSDSKVPEQIRLAAATCVAKVPNWKSFQLSLFSQRHTSPDSTIGLLNPCLESLFRCLSLSPPRHMNVALSTLRACEIPDAIQVESPLARLFQAKGGLISERASLRLTDTECDQIALKLGVNTDMNWCWHKDAWSVAPQNMHFDDWVCLIVPAMIECCYPRTNHADNEKLLPTFQRLSCVDWSFARSVFFAVVVDVLDRKKDHRDASKVEEDTWLGAAGDESRKMMSSCFGALLSVCVSEESDELRAYVELLADMVDTLQNLTARRFQQSKNHQKNKKASPTGKRLSTKRVTSWPCIPFGSVIELDGFELAKACYQSGLHHAALYYVEQYAERRFSRSSLVREVIQSVDARDVEANFGSADISGLPSLAMQRGSQQLGSDGIDMFSLIRDCYTALGHQSSHLAADRVVSGLRSRGDAMECSLFRQAQRSVPMQSLWMSDVGMNSSTAHEVQAIPASLKASGMTHTLEVYLSGVVQEFQQCIDTGNASRAQHFEQLNQCRIINLTWAALSKIEDDQRFDASGVGFYSSMLDALTSILRDDIESSAMHLSHARWKMLDGADVRTPGKAEDFIDACKAVDSLDNLVRIESSFDEDPGPKLQSFIKSMPSPQANLELTAAVHEIGLNHLLQQVHEVAGSGAISLCVDTLFQNFSVKSQAGKFAEAGALLCRIRNLLTTTGTMNPEWASHLKLEEASVSERCGDFTRAIQSAKEVIATRAERMTSPRLHHIVSRAYIQCGSWMTKHKLAPAQHILSNFLEPGSQMALDLLKRGPHDADALRLATSSWLAISDMSSSILDTVLTRVKSLAWYEEEARLKEQKKELEEVSRMYNKLKKKTPSKNPSKEARDMALYKRRLEREVAHLNHTRDKIFKSVETHREMVLSSIAKALAAVGTGDELLGQGKFVTRYVYQLIGVWFAAIEDMTYNDAMDSVLSEAVEKISSHRLVPLASQLFSRLGPKNSESTCDFQINLHRLVQKLCQEHPYHCYPFLVALANGTNVGTGVNGCSAETFLENAGSERLEVANDLIQTITIDSSDSFVGSLLESYLKMGKAYIDVAMAPVGKETGAIAIKKVCKSTARLDNCLEGCIYRPCVLTRFPIVRPGRDYGDGKTDPIGSELINKFDKTFDLADGGLHKPKIVRCSGSRGRTYRQLVKGGDEIRQDAVMQQVFNFVNAMMATSRKGSDDELLKLVTYNIIPLSPASGVRRVNHQTIYLTFIGT